MEETAPIPPGVQSSLLSILTKRLHPSCFVPPPRAFLFPSDQQIDLELWAEQTEFDSTELHHMRVQDNCIFSISPKTGSLSPGQEQVVELKYRCSPLPHPPALPVLEIPPFPWLLENPGLVLCDSRVP